MMSDEDNNTSPDGPVRVRIFDRVYTLRSAGGNQEHVRRVARTSQPSCPVSPFGSSETSARTASSVSISAAVLSPRRRRMRGKRSA